MISRGRRRPIRVRFATILLGAATALGLTQWAEHARGAQTPPDPGTTLVLFEQQFHALLLVADGIAEAALARSPAFATELAAAGPLATRLEGVGVLGPDLRYRAWRGSPAATRPGEPRFATRVEGVRTRLIVNVGPDDRGRSASACFIIDSTNSDLAFEALLPARLRGAIEVDFVDSLASGPTQSPLLRSPSGEILGQARVLPTDPETGTTPVSRRAVAVAALVLLALVGLSFDWRAASRSPVGSALSIAVICAGRLLLLQPDAPLVLLPRSIGSASLFGAGGIGGALRSPGDLVLTGLAAVLIAGVLRTRLRILSRRRPWIAVAFAVAALVPAVCALDQLAILLAKNSRIALADRPPSLNLVPENVLWLGLVLPLLAVGSIAGTSMALIRRGDARGSRRRMGSTAVATILVLGPWMIFRLGDGAGVAASEQLRTQQLRQALTQSSLRAATLESAVATIAERHRGGVGALQSPEFVAYRDWVESPLYGSGYKSSIEILDDDENRISQFSFDLPPLAPDLANSGSTRARGEAVELSPSRLRSVLHAEARIEPDSGFVVGHVLDEPDNLPFLPSTQPFLAALGPSLTAPGIGKYEITPEYVLYDADGGIVLSTLHQPPADTLILREAAANGTTQRIVTGGQAYLAVAGVEPPDRRMHLLLLPIRSGIETGASAVRLLLFGLLVWAAGILASKLLRPGGLSRLVASFRGSFYRKLVATLLLASVVPLIGLALVLRGYIENRGEAARLASATQAAAAAQRAIEDVLALVNDTEDGLLSWLSEVVGQEIHIFHDGLLEATSRRELFSSGLLSPRLDGAVYSRLVEDRMPIVVERTQLGATAITVAYSPIRVESMPPGSLILAVPLIAEERQIQREVTRVLEMILLATVVLVGLLAAGAAVLARTVATPVRELMAASARIGSGDYSARLSPRTQDELAGLAHGFNSMAEALADQREDLERRRDYMEALLEHATTGVLSLDPEGRIVTVNPAAAALLEGCRDRLTAGAELVTALYGCESLAPLAEALLRADPSRGEPIEVDLGSGSELQRLRLVRVELRDAAHAGFGELILLDDVTDLMRSNQLEAWADMARAIAHEIKNPLTPIQLSTEHVARLLADRGILPSKEIDDCLDAILRQVRALREIASEFSTYAKLPNLAPESVDPVEFMSHTVAPYRAAPPPGIRIVEEYAPTPRITIDRRVLARAVINLVENALQAMPEGGTLTLVVAEAAAGREVEFCVRDTGHGVSPRARSRLFEPYFSTKSSGTGLGLAIVRRAVEAHGGRIEVENAPAVGAEFRISIPATGPAAGC